MQAETSDRPPPTPPSARLRGGPVMPASRPRSFLLRLYLALSRRAASVVRSVLERRRAEGKEDPERFGERMGEASLPRPEGQLVWFHAASVGEAASLLEMLRRLTQARPEVHCLVTTGTVTSAQFLADRLPENCLHQYSPGGRGPLGAAVPRPLAPRPRGLDRERALAGDAQRDPRPRHPHAPDQRAHLGADLPPLAGDARVGADAARAVRPHPRPGRAGRRAAHRRSAPTPAGSRSRAR